MQGIGGRGGGGGGEPREGGRLTDETCGQRQCKKRQYYRKKLLINILNRK